MRHLIKKALIAKFRNMYAMLYLQRIIIENDSDEKDVNNIYINDLTQEEEESLRSYLKKIAMLANENLYYNAPKDAKNVIHDVSFAGLTKNKARFTAYTDNKFLADGFAAKTVFDTFPKNTEIIYNNTDCGTTTQITCQIASLEE